MRFIILAILSMVYHSNINCQNSTNLLKRLNSSTNAAISIPKDGWAGKSFIIDMDQDGINDRLIFSTRDVGGGGYFVNMKDLTSYKFSLFGWGNGDDSKSPIIQDMTL
jgi:hypothetical protein